MFIYIQREGIALVLNLRQSVARGASITWRLFVAVFLIATTLAVKLTIDELPAEAAACVVDTNYTVSDAAGSPTVRTVTFTNASGCTYELEAGVTSFSYAVVGGCCGGGGGGTTGQNKGGSGVRGGQIVQASNVAITSGATLTLTVGNGGSGGAAQKNGVSGSSSLLSTSDGTSVSALGGNRGQRASSRTNNSGSGTGNGGAGASNSAAGSGGAGSSN
ncbi:MAG: glycine-rich domain-containing protein, partial [Acidimicrobiaceae bacterium]